MFQHPPIGDVQCITRLQAAARVVRARAPQSRMAVENLLGNTTWLVADEAELEAVATSQLGRRVQVSQIRRQLLLSVDALGQGTFHKGVQRRGITEVPRVRVVRKFPVQDVITGVGVAVDFHPAVPQAGDLPNVSASVESLREPVHLVQRVVPHGESFVELVDRESVRLAGRVFDPAERGAANVARSPPCDEQPSAHALDEFPFLVSD